MARSWLDFFFDLLFAAVVGVIIAVGVFFGLEWAGVALMLAKLGAALVGLGVTALVMSRRLGSESRGGRWRRDRYGRDSDWDTTRPGGLYTAVAVVEIVADVVDIISD